MDLDFGDGTFANAAEGYIAFSLGSLAGIQRAAQGAVSSVNFVSNVAVVSSGLAIRATGLGEADYAVGSLKELNQIEEDLGVAVDFAKEAAKDPGKVLQAAGSAAQDYVSRLASGDKRAIAQASAVVTELLIDVATGNAAKKGAEALGDIGEAVAEQSIKQSKKARKASVLLESKSTPKSVPKKVKTPDAPSGGNKGPTPGFQEYAKKDAAIQRQVRRAELDQKFGRSGDLNADITSGRAFSSTKSATSKSKPNRLAELSDELFAQEIARRAEKRVGGTGAAAGSRKHTYAERLIKRYQDLTGERTHLEVEQSYVNGQLRPRGTLGSSRPDLFDPLTGDVYDYKFTIKPGRGIPLRQKAKNARNLPKVGQQTEINP